MDEKTNNALRMLDLTPGATLADVRRSYRELALISHPDKLPAQVTDRATTKFTQINEAYMWLVRNPDRLTVPGNYRKGSPDGTSTGEQTGPDPTGVAGDPLVKRFRQAARGHLTDADSGLYLYPEIDVNRAANFVAALCGNPRYDGIVASISDLLLFYDIDGSGEEGIGITRSNRLVNNNANTLYDLSALVEVTLKEGRFFWSELVVRRRGRRQFESAGYTEKSPGKILAGILQNLIA